MPDILDSLRPSDLALFKRDFQEIMRVAFGMDKAYGESSRDFDFFLPKYKKLIQTFDKKYKNLKLKLRRTEEELKLRIFVTTPDVKGVFSSVASKLAGIKSIGAAEFGTADISETTKFTRELEKVNDKVYISYYEAESGSNTIYLEYDKKEKMVEVHYNPKAIRECKSPEYKLIAYYAAKEFDKKLDLMAQTAKFGFVSNFVHEEQKEWLEGFKHDMNE